MPSIIELKSVAETQYNFLLEVLEVERAVHPETYDTAVRVGEKIRNNLISYGQLDNLKPIPPLDANAKK
ncbi:hypothetical protein FACS1894120_5520 [Clostridia bacterium]|nr:hypothetical protein FACS1894120_5520 [Clostridia bacterium]